MWIKVALSRNSVHFCEPVSYSWIEGEQVENIFFDKDIAEALEADGFLTDMRKLCDAMFDWGDCDFFLPAKCILLRDWLCKRLSRGVPETLQPIYETLLDYAQKAIDNDTGISFDF